MAADVGLGEGLVQGGHVDEDRLDAGQRETVTQVLILRAFGIQSADEDNGLLAHRASPIFRGDSPLRRNIADRRDQPFRFFHQGSKVLTSLPGGWYVA